MEQFNTYQEMMNQPQTLDHTWEIINQLSIEPGKEDICIFSGCGTSYYLAMSAAIVYQQLTGTVAISVPASEIFTLTEQVFVQNKRYRLVMISRSGTTTEILQAMKKVKLENLATMVAVTCNPQSKMRELAVEEIVLAHVQEKSVVMTSSYSNMLYALIGYAAKMVGNESLLSELQRVPKQAERLLENLQVIERIANDLHFKRFIFLGAGSYYGLACEANLKLKEMTQTECEAYSNLEFRHGPISVVDEHTVVVLLYQQGMLAVDQSLLADTKKYGAYTLIIGDGLELDVADEMIDLQSGLSHFARMVLQIIPLQVLAFYRAIALGFNPDQPHNLNQVVKVELPKLTLENER